jgi:hypothetical protein
VLIACIAPAAAADSAALECGKPYALCGNSIPAGVQCDKGAGWCEPGYYCGFSKDPRGTMCLPVPKDCGRAGNKCCPSNADKPHRANSTGIDPVTGKEEVREPFCRDGSTCFYDSQSFVRARAPAAIIGENRLREGILWLNEHGAIIWDSHGCTTKSNCFNYCFNRAGLCHSGAPCFAESLTGRRFLPNSLRRRPPTSEFPRMPSMP